MKIIGLCGGSGSGKSLASGCFEKFGGVVLDADKIYHELINAPSPCVDAIVAAFGDSVLLNGAIDRKQLREIVFADEKKRLLLNAISHRFVIEEIDHRIASAKQESKPFVVIDAPLLLESGLDEQCDIVVCVIANIDLRIKRIVERDHISIDAAKERIARQITDDELIKRCDAVIYNESTPEELENQCKALLTVLGLKTE